MATPLTRRAILPAIAVGALGAGALWRINSRSDAAVDSIDAAADVTSQEIADKLTLFTGAGGNVLAHEGPESVALIDGGSPDRSAALLAAVAARFGGKPVAALVNTHWHLDQTGSNDTLGADGVPIIAHENTLRWMTVRIEQHWGGPYFEPRDEVARPTRTFYVGDELEHGGETISLVYTPRAHTDGDISAIFPSANVIAASGIAYAGSFPILDTATNGWIGEMLDATRTLLERADDNTVIVAANGPVLTREHLVAQEEMIATIYERISVAAVNGKGALESLHDGIADDYVEDWGDPTDFVLAAWEGFWDQNRGVRASAEEYARVRRS